MHRPPLPQEILLVLISVKRLSRPQGHSAIGRILCQWKIPMTQAGIEPATFRFVAQHLKHCATATFMIMPRWILFKILNVSQKKSCKENQSTFSTSSSVFSVNLAIYEIMWEDVLQPDRPHMTTKRCEETVPFARRITEAKKKNHTHDIQHLLLSHGNNSNANAPQYYVLRTSALSVLLFSIITPLHVSITSAHLTVLMMSALNGFVLDIQILTVVLNVFK